MSIDYNLFKIFIKVSELGSFTKAALALKQPKSRVSRAISRLEAQMEVELIRRTTRKVTLTNTGKELYTKISSQFQCIEAELIRVQGKEAQMNGVIKLTAPDSIAQNSLAKIISKYNLKYPDVTFEILVTNSYLDLVKENIDIAFRAGKLKDSTMIQRKFLETNFILVCSQEYINKYSVPRNLSDMKNHKFLLFTPLQKRFFKKGIVSNVLVASDSLPMLLQMALNGDGITAVPHIGCQEYIARKDLIHVLPSWQTKSENIHMLYHSSKKQSKRVKEFIKMAKEFYL